MAFKITRDHITKKGEEGYAAGIQSLDWDDKTLYPERIRIRLRDDDGIVYYHGWASDETEETLGAAYDWGMAFAGTAVLDTWDHGVGHFVDCIG